MPTTRPVLPFDPAQCEAQYNLRQRHPDFYAVLADWQVRSAQTRADLVVETDLPYGESDDERLDLFPAASAGAPVVLFIHGGYWQSGDKRDVSFLARHLVAAGIAVAINHYGLAPAHSLDTMVAQTRRAVEWLHHYADRYGIDRQRIHLMGHSAGAHLAAMMLTEHGPQGSTPAAASLKSVISISGLFDLTPLLHTSLNRALQLDAEQAARLSPALLDRWSAAPLYTIVGEDETDAFREQAGWIDAHWDAVHAWPLVPGKHHYTALDIFKDPSDPWLARILDLVLERHSGLSALSRQHPA